MARHQCVGYRIASNHQQQPLKDSTEIRDKKELAMELLDRYLEAVRKHLPWQRQDDIIAELRANLEAQLEEKEAALGRPLTQAEAETWLKQLGSPMQMAAPYQPQQYLIGPGLFPSYRNVMKIALTWATAIYCIANVVALIATTPQMSDLVHVVANLPFILLTTAAWVTLVFAGIEYAVAHQYVKLPAECSPSVAWSLASLPPLGTHANGGKKPKSLAAAVAEVIFGFIFLVWLLLIPGHPYLLMGPGAYLLEALPYKLAPVWVPVFWWAVAVNVLQLAWHTANLIRGTWQKPQPILHYAAKAFGLAPILLLLAVPDQAAIVLKHPELDQARYDANLLTINTSIHWSVAVICVIVVAQLVWDIAQSILSANRKRAAAM
jgi:hypothetical protein